MNRTFSTYTKVALLLVLMMGFTACQDDETVFDRIVGRTWVGDLGFTADGDALESGVSFDGDGFGIDEQCFFDFDECLPALRIRWWVDDGTLYLDYGKKFAPRELRGVYVSGHIMTGTLYIDGRYWGAVTLEMSR